MLARLASVIDQEQLPVLVGLATQRQDQMIQMLWPRVAEHGQQRKPWLLRELLESAAFMAQRAGQ
jgi:hypothetical protein